MPGVLGLPPIEMLPMIKMSQKKLLFLQFQFLLESSRATAINNNSDLEGPGPLNLIFANQFKRITQVKLRVLILKLANSGPHLTLSWT